MLFPLIDEVSAYIRFLNRRIKNLHIYSNLISIAQYSYNSGLESFWGPGDPMGVAPNSVLQQNNIDKLSIHFIINFQVLKFSCFLVFVGPKNFVKIIIKAH